MKDTKLKSLACRAIVFMLGLLAVSAQAYDQQYGYDENSNITSRVNANGQNFGYQYDLLNRLQQIDLPDGGQVTYTYDASGRRSKMVDPEGETYYAYDSYGRLAAIQRAGFNPIYYYYDNNNRITSMKDPAQRTTYYNYDADGRVKWVQNHNGFDYYTYDAITGLLVTHHRLRNDQSVIGVTAYGYNNARRLVQVTHYNQNFGAKAQFTYTYDYNGNTTKVVRAIPGDTETADYDYDLLNRLTSVTYQGGDRSGTFEQFSYDTMGNITSRTTELGAYAYSYGLDNRLLSINGPDGNISLEYDDAGNVLRKIRDNSSEDYQYDSLNRLVQWTDGSNVIAYIYDGDGQRISKSVNGQVTRYVNDNSAGFSRVLLETNNTFGVTRFLNYGHSLSSQMDASGTSYYLFDKPGRSVVELERDGNAAIARYKYSAFGMPTKSGTAVNGYQYAGEQHDDNAGLVYLRSRYYDPELGRFIGRDTFAGFMERPQSLNRYAYVENNPESLVDPSGFASGCTAIDPYAAHEQNQVADVWTTVDFLSHYLTGGGDTVDLGDVGLGLEYQNSASVRSVTSEFINGVMQGPIYNVTATDRRATNVTDVGEEDFTGWPSLFSVGDGILNMDANCISGNCTFVFETNDRFIDALDINDAYNGNQDVPFSDPFDIHHKFTEKRSYAE